MKILSWNVRGLGRGDRRLVVNELICNNKVQIALIQESKIASMTMRIVREVWGSKFVKWVTLEMVGSTGGILMLWDSRHVAACNSSKGESSVSTEVKNLATKKKWLITSVSGPNSDSKRPNLWRELDAIKGRWNGAWCVGGDWNVVWFPCEKL